jgi:hypothetical protein
LSRNPGFPTAPGSVVTPNRLADAVRAELSGVQTVTGVRECIGADVGSGTAPLADFSTGGIGYDAAGTHGASGQPARGARPASGAVGGSGLVTRCISAQGLDRRSATLEIGSRDVRIHRSWGLQGYRARSGGGKRGRIVGFSTASARRLLFCARNFPALAVMVTLTYPGKFPVDGRVVMDHWRRMRQWLIRNGNPVGLWFKEFQARGAPHFHVFLPHDIPKSDVAAAWYAIVGSGDVRHLRAGTRTERLRNPKAAGAYAAKYASKTLQKEVPEDFCEVGRFWGTWGNPSICQTTTLRGREAVSIVRTVRRGYESRRKGWRCRRRFRDNGRAGFTGWESGPLAAQALQRLTRWESGLILGLEREIGNANGKGRGASTNFRPSNQSEIGRQTHQSAPVKRNHQNSKRRSLGILSRS